MRKKRGICKRVVLLLFSLNLCLFSLFATAEYKVGVFYSLSELESEASSLLMEELEHNFSTIPVKADRLKMIVETEKESVNSEEQISIFPTFTYIKGIRPTDLHDTIVLKHLLRQYSLDSIITLSLSPLDQFLRLQIGEYNSAIDALNPLYDRLLTQQDSLELVYQIVNTLQAHLGGTERAFLTIEESSPISSLTIDNRVITIHPLIALSDQRHTIEAVSIDGDLYTNDIYLRKGEWRKLLIDFDKNDKTPILVNSTTTLSPPQLLFSEDLPLVLEFSQEGYLDKHVVIREAVEEVEVTLKRISFDPTVIIDRSQTTFYNSLARTAIVGFSSIIGQTLCKEATTLHTFLNGAIIVSSLESIYRLFDYYNKSKYSISN